MVGNDIFVVLALISVRSDVRHKLFERRLVNTFPTEVFTWSLDRSPGNRPPLLIYERRKLVREQHAFIPVQYWQ
jgi:hypothetical protein